MGRDSSTLFCAASGAAELPANGEGTVLLRDGDKLTLNDGWCERGALTLGAEGVRYECRQLESPLLA